MADIAQASLDRIETNSNQTESQINEEVKDSLRLIEDLKFFLATAPAGWQENQVIRRYYLNHDEGFVSCVFWNNLYFITGTDIVRCIVYKFEHFGRKITDRKKFEEGIFSDLRNLKCDTDAILEPPRSDFLEFLFKNSCLRTQKKQKVFFWFNVPHDKLMADALERDLKKEKLGQNPTTVAHKEPALSFHYDENKSLFNQLAEHMEYQKKLTHEISEAEKPSEANEDTESNSPEYTSSSNFNKNSEEFDFLNHDTPAQYKAPSDYEDDFPLDYFDQDYEDANNSNEFITLDPTFHMGFVHSMDENYDNYVDPSVFTNPVVTQVSNQLVHNDEYLIEQTQPIKTPVSTTSISKHHLHPHELHHPEVESYSQHPASAKYPPPGQFYPESGHIPSRHMYQTSQDPSYNFMHPEPEGWYPHPGQPVPSYPMYSPYEPVPMHQPGGYVLVNDHIPDYHTAPPHSGVYYIDNNMAQPSPVYAVNPMAHASPSTRQQQISANMMMKKRQLQQQQPQAQPVRFKNTAPFSVSKPSPGRAKSSSSAANINLNDVVANKNVTKIVNFKQYDQGKEPSENLILTPESSITQPEQSSSQRI